MGFLYFTVKDAIDIILVAFLLYYIYRLMKSSGSMNVFIGIIIFILLWVVVTHMLSMRLLGALLDKVMSVGAIVLIVIFQNDIRRFLSRMGTQKDANVFVKLFQRKHQLEDRSSISLPICMACINMSKQRTGALIVVEMKDVAEDVEQTGLRVDAVVSQRLIENIFYKGSPLHDGAMLIREERIVAAGCILTVSHNTNIPSSLGLRHRAGLGMAQESDAVVIIVSEETGHISLAHNGRLKQNVSIEEVDCALNGRTKETKTLHNTFSQTENN